MNPQIQVTCEEEEEEEGLNMDGPDGPSVDESDAKETASKVQFVFQQVRSQIRSQVGAKTSRGSLVEVVNRLKDKQSLPQRSEEKLPDESDCKDPLKDDFEKKLEGTQTSLRDEFEEQLSQLRDEMKAYTDRALRDLEWKLQRASLKEQEGKKQDKKVKSSSATLSKRGRTLTRTMTAVIPKASPAVVLGPRAKSESLISESSRTVVRDPGASLGASSGANYYHVRKPLLPVCPQLHQCKKTVGSKAKMGK